MNHVNGHGVVAPSESIGGTWRTICSEDIPTTAKVFGPAVSVDTVTIRWARIALGRRRMGYVAACPKCGQTFTFGSMALAHIEPEYIRELIEDSLR